MKNYQLIVTTILCLFVQVFSFGQESRRLDSLLKILPETKSDTARVDVLNAIASSYRNSDMEKVEEYGQEAILLAEKINYSRGRVAGYFNIGNMHYIMGDFTSTLDYYLKALEVQEEQGDQKGVANALMGIGNVHAILNNHNEAIKYQEQSLQIRLELEDSMGMAGSYNNLGSIYEGMGEFEKALEYNQKSLAIKEKLNYWKGMSSSYGNIGTIYYELGKYDLAVEYQLKALEIRQELNNKKGMVMSYTDLGKIYMVRNQHKKAYESQLKSLELSKEVQYKEGEMGALLALSNTCDKLGKYKESLQYFKYYSQIKDSVFTIEKSKEIANLESTYLVEQRQAEIELLDQQNTIQNKEIQLLEQEQKLAKLEADEANRSSERKSIFLWSTLIVIGLLLAVVVISILNIKIRKQNNELLLKKNEEINLQKLEVDQKNKEITDSIVYAKRIQGAILPSTQEIDGLLNDYFVVYKPKDIVAGDFYWVENLGDKLLIAVADCTGHGVPGALVSVVCHNALNRAVREFELKQPGPILDKVSELVIDTFDKSTEDIKDGMDIALCSVDFKQKKLEYAGANNPVWIGRNVGGDTEILKYKPDKQPVGKFYDPSNFTNHTIELNSGDVLYLFTDGYVDQFGGPRKKKMKHKPFEQLLQSIAQKDTLHQKVRLEDAFYAWKGDMEQIDDVCVMGVKIS